MKIATWNVNSLNVRLPQVLDWLAATQTDVLALQETKLSDDKFPFAELQVAGWQSLCFGQPTYNGVAILVRQGLGELEQTQRNLPAFPDAQCRLLATTLRCPDAAPLRLVCAYFPNGQSLESDKFVYKLKWLAALRAWLKQQQALHPRLLLLGDFNIAPEDRDVHDPELWRGQVLCTDDERAHFAALLQSEADWPGLVDAFRLFPEQPAQAFTWWDYRQAGFRRNRGLRIDHILVSQALVAQVKRCVIDIDPRRNERPSDHAPVWVELVNA